MKYTEEEEIFIEAICKILKYNKKSYTKNDQCIWDGLSEGQMNSIKYTIEKSMFFEDFSYIEGHEYDRNFQIGYNYNGNNEDYIYYHKESFILFHSENKNFFDNVNNKYGEILYLDYYTMHDDETKNNINANKIFINKEMYDFYIYHIKYKEMHDLLCRKLGEIK